MSRSRSGWKYLFGPVFSRRLGVSLGIDLIPFKTCSLNCVYCECGETTDLTVGCREYVPVSAVLAELEQFLSRQPCLDYLTFAGSGEPLLHSGIGRIIDALKRRYPRYRVAVLTNGTLLMRPEVQEQLASADLVVPSLDAATEEVFQKVNRPHRSLHCAALISGLAGFRRSYKGRLALEVFIVPGLNDTPQELTALQEAARLIGPDSLQLNTLDRAGTEDWVTPADPARLEECARILGGAEVFAGGRPRRRVLFSGQGEQDLSCPAGAGEKKRGS